MKSVLTANTFQTESVYYKHQMSEIMEKEEKELLIKDICGRLPYDVKPATKSSVWNISRLNFWKNNKYYNDYTLLENGSPIWCEAYVNNHEDPYARIGIENIIPIMLEHYNEYLKDKSVRKKYGYVW